MGSRVLQSDALGFFYWPIDNRIGLLDQPDIVHLFDLWLNKKFVFLLVHILFVITGRRQETEENGNFFKWMAKGIVEMTVSGYLWQMRCECWECDHSWDLSLSISASTMALRFLNGFFTLLFILSAIFSNPSLISSKCFLSLDSLSFRSPISSPPFADMRFQLICGNNSILITFFRSSFIAKMSENIKRAQRVQVNVEANNYAIETEAKLRQKVSIESSIDNLEKELRQEIARSLKNSESKVIHLIKKTEQRLKEIEGKKRTISEVEEYNSMVKQCEKARWEFMVHRQACGFTIKNYELVTTIYKLPRILQE